MVTGPWRRRRWRVFSGAVVMAMAGACYLWSAQREIGFDAQRWKSSPGSRDRWRMVADLQRVLDATRPGRGDILLMLEGEAERRQPYRQIEQKSQPQILRYELGRRPPWNGGTGELDVYFTPDGQYEGSILRQNSD